MRLILASTAVLALAACGAPDREPSGDPSGRAASAAPPVFTAEQIDRAMPAPETTAGGSGAGSAPADGADAAAAAARPDPGLVRLQILLDRSRFSPGVIDGLRGENTRQAVAAFREAEGLEGDAIDDALMQRLTAADSRAAMTTYVITEQDLAGPFSPPPSGDLAEQARQGVRYTGPRERLAERFHITEALLQALNPDVDFRRAGQRLVVPAVGDPDLPEVARIVVDKGERSLRAFDASDRLIAFYPATIGSESNPAPSGTLRVNGVAPEPDYTFDPEELSYGSGTETVVVPAGPNNPVGSVWIDLSRDGYGIHGSPDPSKIAKTASHGCVRLTNWDAEQLAAAVKPGVEVRFVS
jgi:lipoprotein-anchoring transpeptidase ErfK/SrfK